MTAEEIKKLLENTTDPIYKIEADLKMPKTTLQKALKGQRELSVKWEQLLKERFWKPSEDEMMRLPVDYNRQEKDYFSLIRQFLDRHSLLLLKYEIENNKVLSDVQKRSQLTSLNFKLQRTKS
jgi:hypothetical protein